MLHIYHYKMQSSRHPPESPVYDLTIPEVSSIAATSGSANTRASFLQRQTRYPYSENNQQENGQSSKESPNKESFDSPKVPLRERLHHFTWAWFACTMSTGGLSLLLNQTPHQFSGLTILGDIVFVLDFVLFILFCGLITARFILFPSTFKASLSHPTESLFIPTFLVSIVNIFSNVVVRGIPHAGNWLQTTMLVLFWIYCAVTFLVAIAQYFYLFTGRSLTVQSMTPQWILPIFPIMLSGTLASVLGQYMTPHDALPILIAGVTFQGLGMLISTFLYGVYLSRLMTSGLPSPNKRPGMFIAVGPPAFTGLAVLGISESFSKIYPAYTKISNIQNPAIIADVLRLIALSTAIFLWATAFWFFSIALVSVIHGVFWSRKERATGKKTGMGFHLVWWALVFPNVGFTLVTSEIGEALMSEGITWVASVMTVLIVLVWLVTGIAHIRAVWQGKILWPGKDEDKDE